MWQLRLQRTKRFQHLKLTEVHDVTSLAKLVEVLLFVADEPQTPASLLEQLVLDEAPEGQLPFTEEDLEDALVQLQRRYEADGGVVWQVVRVAGGYQLLTKPAYAPLVRKVQLQRERKGLSRAALEVLAIVAYRQPVTRAEVEYVRGVGSDYAISKLLEKQLIEPAGRADLPGRPLLYKTSAHFLRYFGLNEPTDLPSPAELKPGEEDDNTFQNLISDGETPEA